jgi:cytochrome P450
MVSDPKALQYLYANAYSFIRQKHSRNLVRMLFGPGLAGVEFDDHKKQRKVMQPAFGPPRLRDLFPVFIRHTQKVCSPSSNAPR